MSDSACVAARSHSLPSSGLESYGGSQRGGRSAKKIRDDACRDVLRGRPPTGTTLHIKRPRERRTGLSNHWHRRRRHRHSFRFNFFSRWLLMPPSFSPWTRAISVSSSVRLSSSISTCEPRIFSSRHRFSLSRIFRFFFFCSPLIRISFFIMLSFISRLSLPLPSTLCILSLSCSRPFIRFLLVRIIN